MATPSYSIFRRTRGPGDEIAARLVLFPCAGADAAMMYRDWPPPPSAVEKVCVQLAGRGARRRERPARRMSTLIDELLGEVGTIADRPLIFFGHSMGAWVAYELAMAMQASALQPPRHLVVSASLPILLDRLPPFVHRMDLGQLREELRVLGGTPASVLENGEALALYSEAIQADFEVFETHRHEHRRPLAVNASLWAAVDDPRVPIATMPLWREVISGRVDECLFSGGHMFLDVESNRERGSRMLASIIDEVRAASGAAVIAEGDREAQSAA